MSQTPLWQLFEIHLTHAMTHSAPTMSKHNSRRAHVSYREPEIFKLDFVKPFKSKLVLFHDAQSHI
jgi:hypothetical protein